MAYTDVPVVSSTNNVEPPATPFNLPRAVLVSAVYLIGWYALDVISHNFESAPEIQVWYPPAGLTIVLLVVFGLRYWPLLLVNSMMHNYLVSDTPLDLRTFAVFTAFNTLGPIVARVLLLRWRQIDARLYTLYDVGWFIGIAALALPLLNALIQATNFAWAGLFGWSDWWLRVLHYWAGDATGVAMVAPLLLLLLLRRVPWAWAHPPAAAPPLLKSFFTRATIGEVLLLVVALGATIWFAYDSARVPTLDYTYLIFMPLIWIALQHGIAGAVVAVLIINVGAVLLGGHAVGESNGLSLQFGLLTVSVTGIVLGAFMTDRERNIVALHESEQQYKTITRATNDAVWNWDLQTNLVWRNEGFERLFGHPCTTDIKPVQFWYDHIHPDDQAETIASIHRVIEDGTQWSAEYRFQHKDGAYVVVFDRAYVMRDDDGTPTYAIGGMMDITARKAAEAELHASEQRLRTVLENAPVVLFTVDTAGIFSMETGGGLRALGVDPKEVAGKSMYDVERDRPQVIDNIERTLAGEHVHTLVSTDDYVYDTRYIPLRDQHGDVTSIIGVATDVTELKRANEQQLLLERRLLEAQKFESLAVLTGGVAHDFNNLLMAVLGNIDMARYDIPDDSPAHKALHLSEVAAKRAVDLVRQMLAYAGRGTIAAQPLDLNMIVEEMAQLLGSTTLKTATTTLHLAADLPFVNADATHLRQVIMNLVINGAQALHDEPGTVTVTTRLAVADAADLAMLHRGAELTPGAYVALDVADTGSGIDAATRGRIFDPYFTTKPSGRGLGLAAVLGIVYAHGGGLRVQSVLGRGTTFTILLPPFDEDAR